AHIMLADEFPEMGCGNKSPETLKGTSISIMLYVEGVDAQYAQAIQAGGKEIHPLQDHFYGDRSGTVQDPFGHVWIISQHIKDPTMEEIEAGAAAYMKEEQAKK
ncbi:MAG: VOC family protein, partial [Glaciimonas sp.]|nr:VOC family protein [Glaciimonas sp.]